MTGNLFVSSGRTIRYAITPYGVTDSSMDSYEFAGTFRAFDLVLDALNSLVYYIPAGACSLQSLARSMYSSRGDTRFSIGDPVIHYSLTDYNERDGRLYRSFLDNISQFGRSLFGDDGVIPTGANEHPCYHTTFCGDVIPTTVPLASVDSSISFLGATKACQRLTNDLVNAFRVTDVIDFNFDLVSSSDSHFRFSLIDWLDLVKSQSTWTQDLYSGIFHWQRSLSDVSYDLSSSGLDISWKGSVHTFPFPAYPNGETTTYDGFARFSFDLQTGDRALAPGDVDYFSYGVTHTFGFSNMSRLYPQLDDGPSSYYWYNDNGGPAIALSYPSASGSSDSSLSLMSSLTSLGHNFKLSIDSEFHEFIGAVAFSSADAVRDLEGSSGINILQNLQKIPSIASALPMIREGVDLMSRIARRDFSLATLKEIADFASSTELQNDFQWQPFIKVFSDYIPSIRQVLLAKPSGLAVGRGKTFYHLPPGSLGRESCDLTVRTKIVLATNFNSWLLNLLKVDGLGLLPKISNLWDLIPFTFVVNWFTGIGKAIKAAEYSLLLRNLPAYYVHSYLFESPVSPSELSSIGLSNSNQSLPLTLRVFYRDHTAYGPVPRDSKFGIGIPSNLPPLQTVGSLIWQLIFS